MVSRVISAGYERPGITVAEYGPYVISDLRNKSLNPDALLRQCRTQLLPVLDVRLSTDGIAFNVLCSDVLDASQRHALDGGEGVQPMSPLGADSVLGRHDGTDDSPRLSEHKELMVQMRMPAGHGFRLISHNFCDPTTWWQRSIRQVDQPAAPARTPRGADALKAYQLDHQELIDVRHARFPFEDHITEKTVTPEGATMANIIPSVKINGVVVPPEAEYSEVHPDRYEIDYPAGTVRFEQPRKQTDKITVSFRKAGESTYVIAPPKGRRYVLQDAIIAISEDLDFGNGRAFITDTYGSHSKLTGSTVVSLREHRYKSIHDLQASVRQFWGPLPSGFGGAGGVSSPKWTFQLAYIRGDALYEVPAYVDKNLRQGDESTLSMTFNRIQLSVADHKPIGGALMTATLFGAETLEGEP